MPEIDQIVLNYPESWRDEVEGIVRDYAVKTPVEYVAAGLPPAHATEWVQGEDSYV